MSDFAAARRFRREPARADTVPAVTLLAAAEEITKRYAGVEVVSQVSLELHAGEVHVIAGENGAGKSTVLKVLAGLCPPDSGQVRVAGALVTHFTPAEAIRRGVALVAQHFALVGALTGLENVVLAAPPRGRLGAFRADTARAEVGALLAELGTTLNLEVPVAELGVGDRQRLEIVRALYRRANVLLLDEPTAVLSPSESSALFALLRRLAGEGRAVAVVTHKLQEIQLFADAVTVLRRGRKTFAVRPTSRPLEDATMAAVERGILGEGSHEPPVDRTRAALGEPVATVTGARVGRALVDLDLTVRAGEIVGIAGVAGNGQEELCRVLAGQLALEAGAVRVPRGVAVVHEDRHREGLCLDVPLRDNAVLGEYASLSRHGLLDASEIQRVAADRMRGLHVRAGDRDEVDLDLPVRALSGGNQQKVVCARAFAAAAAGVGLLVLAQPTRGVDVGAARAIRAGVQRAAASGAGIVLVSADTSELRALSDRILVFFRGRATELPSDATDEALGRAMLGGNS